VSQFETVKTSLCKDEYCARRVASLAIVWLLVKRAERHGRVENAVRLCPEALKAKIAPPT
jgi:hypothetical protein